MSSETKRKNRFPTYADLKHFLWNEYRPIAQEVTKAEEGFQPDTNWARRCAPRFFRALQRIESSIGPEARILDVGSWPGSFVRVAKAAFASQHPKVFACGLHSADGFAENLQQDGIEFLACNLDPDIKPPSSIPACPSTIPLASDSLDCITLMEVVEHLYSLKTAFTESFRALKPGGVCYVTTDNIAGRDGLLRAIGRAGTNLDDDIAQTSIWSNYEEIYRLHVRFYSLGQLCEVGKLAGFECVVAGAFENYEDPDVYKVQAAGLRKLLRGDGSRPPIQPKAMLRYGWRLGLGSLKHAHDNKIEVLLRKPAA